MSWAVTAVYFAPGAVVGGAIGWFVIRPVNAVLGWLFRGFNRLFDAVTDGLRLDGRQAAAAQRARAAGLRRPAGPDRTGSSSDAPTGFIPQQDQGRLIVNVQLPDSASLQRTQEAMAQVDKIARETPGVAHTVAIAGMSFLLQANAPTSARCSSSSTRSTSGRAPGCTPRPSWPGCCRSSASGSRTRSSRVRNSSPIPGLGVAGGFKLMVEDRGGLGLAALQTQTDDLIAETAGRSPAWPTSSTQFRSNTPQLFLDIDRTKAAALGVSLDDVNQTLSMYLGSLYVNSFNEFGRHWQVTVQAEGDYPQPGRGHQPAPGPQQVGADGPAGHAGQRARDRRPHRRHALQPLHRPRRSPATCGRASAPATPSTTIDQLAAENLPLSMKAEWTELMFLQIRAGNTALYVFALAVVSVFLALAALYESWSLPLAVILVVPLCLLCSRGRRAVHEPRRQHLRADRPGGAGRAGVQERHPDRRVRQAAAPGGPARASRRRRRRAGCGCGRS